MTDTPITALAETPDITPVSNRSEIVLLFDAEDCNPNGNPLDDNRPRIDPETNIGTVTDVRLKRFLRDQLEADGHTIFLRRYELPDGSLGTRADLALELFDRVVDIEDLVELEEQIDGNHIMDLFLDNAIDCRYFGITLSLDDIDNDEPFYEKEDIELYERVKEHLNAHVQGPVQFTHGRSIHKVFLKDEAETLAPSVPGKRGKSAGTFGDDFRVRYGMYSTSGIVNEHAAAKTRLSDHDIERLDSLVWRALINQTLTRSKFGMAPRLYARIEYTENDYHIGNLHHEITFDKSNSDDPREFTTIDDVTVDVGPFLQTLKSNADRIEQVHLCVSRHLTISTDMGGEEHEATDLPRLIEKQGIDVNVIDVRKEKQRYSDADRQTFADFEIEAE